MNKTALINRIITLGQELETSEGIQASMIVNDMKLAIDQYVKELNPLNKLIAKEKIQEEHECKFYVNAEWTELKCECGKRIKPLKQK